LRTREASHSNSRRFFGTLCHKPQAQSNCHASRFAQKALLLFTNKTTLILLSFCIRPSTIFHLHRSENPYYVIKKAKDFSKQ
ncbi:unnamed protein product, partial [Brugia timori]|uniref:Ovule protein n=1 Tax=Brugia timori TaxID=42155 RepID=A0A0R3QF19_9BILA